MKTRLSKIADIPENTSLALLFSELSALPFALTTEEQARWKKKPEKSEILIIQRLPHFMVLVSVDQSRAESRVLENFRKAGAGSMDLVMKEKIESIVVAGFTDPEHTLAFLEGMLLAGYAFTKYKKEKDDFVLSEVRVYDAGIHESDLSELDIIIDSVFWARDLVNEPLSALNATQMADEFIRKGEEAQFSADVFHKQKIESLKMGGLLAVNRGSIDPPTFTVMEWKPEDRINEQPVVLVGKGVVFDTGGLSLKPTLKSMDYMKSDMAGAAAVGATLYAAARAKLPVHLVGLVPATDNRPDGNALAPGDIITISDGTTVEVLNTDAEGRLILADALCYAKRYQPALVIDLATLTGAASIIAGTHGIPAMSNDKRYLSKLMESGDKTFERIIELPLWEEYDASLKSDVADVSNTGGREGQTIVAAKFLERFTGYPWIHLDIAGTAFLFEKEGYRNKGGTGSGIRLLFNFLKNFK